MAQADWVRYGNAGGAKAAQIAQLRQMFANIGAISDSGRVGGGEFYRDGGDNGGGSYYNPYNSGFNEQLALALHQMGIFANRYDKGKFNPNDTAQALQAARAGMYDLTPEYGNAVYDNVEAGDNGYARVLRSWGDPTGYSFTLPSMADPEREGKEGAYTLAFNADGTIKDVSWQNYKLSKGFLGDNMSWLGPLLVGGLGALGATAGAGAAGAGAAGSGSAAGSGGYFGGLSAGAGGQTGLTAGAAGAAGISAPAGFVLAPEIGAGIGAGVGSAGAGYFGGLSPSQSGLGLQMPSAPSLGSMGGAQGMVVPGVTPGLSAAELMPVGGAAAGGGSALRSLLTMDNLKTGAQLAGPTMSLLSGGAQLGSLPQQPADAPRLPGLEAPPEARGYQAGVAPILDVLGRNKRDGRNRTLLTGPRGVNMESVRARGNSLLGL